MELRYPEMLNLTELSLVHSPRVTRANTSPIHFSRRLRGTKMTLNITSSCSEESKASCHIHHSSTHTYTHIEGLLKTGIIYGISRVINAYRALIKALPSPESNETSSIRNHISVPSETDERGEAYMRNIFRADLDPFLENMDKYWPDLRTLVVTYIYGFYQSDTSILDAITTSLLNVATLVPMDVPAEVGWHMRGTIRNGGSQEQLKTAWDITMAICGICEVELKNQMPRAEDVINEERLIRD